MTATSAPPPGRWDATVANPGRDQLIRSEERLDVHTDRVVAGYARLEKFTVTETRTITVEVTHEEVRLVSVAAPSDGAAGAPRSSSPGGAENGRWMVVNREEVVVSKRIVPVERVRLEVFPVTEQRQVSEEIRKEHIDAGPGHQGPPASYPLSTGTSDR